MSDSATSTSDATTTTNAETSTTDASVTVADVTTSVPDPSTTTSDATTSSTTTSADESSSSGDPWACGCPDNTPIGLDDELPDGETAAELLARFESLSLPMEWFAYDDSLTTVHFEVQYKRGELTLGPGGEDGCQFLSAPCDDGLQMAVVLVATTDDGWVSFEAPAQLTGYGKSARLDCEGVPIGDNAGTLAMQPLQIAGTDLEIESLYVHIDRTDKTKSGVAGMLGASVSAQDCGGACQDDDDCGTRQICIDSICIGGPCGTYEALAEF